MCQISAVVESGGKQEQVMEAVTGLEVVDDGVVLSTFFEDPKKISGVVIHRIDFLGGSVVLKSIEKKERE